MIEQILCTSCEHQAYRRAAQITALQLHRYPIELFDIVWANHRNFHTDTELVERLSENGLENYRKVLDLPESNPMRNYSLSCFEVTVRALKRIQASEKNTILLQDDILLNINHIVLNGKLRNLMQAVKAEVVQLTYGVQIIKNRLFRLIAEAPDFMRGTVATGQSALYITPIGATLLLEHLSETDNLTSLEAHLGVDLHKASWVFSVVHPNLFATQSILQGDSIMVWHTKQPHLKNRTDNPNIETENMELIDRFKLCNTGTST